jgi:hypothetical protein
MLLTKYKKNKKGRTWADIGDIFGLEPYQIYRMAMRGAEIKGWKGRRAIVLTTVLAEEGK